MLNFILLIPPSILILLGLLFKQSKLIAILISAYVWILIGLNTKSTDYPVYEYIYNCSTIKDFDPQLETTFKYTCALFKSLGFTFQEFRMFWALACSILLYKCSKRLSVNNSFILAFYLIWPALAQVSGLRNTLSAIIVCYSVPFLAEEEHGYRNYIMGIIIATLVHTSSIFYLIFLLSTKTFGGKQYLRIFFATLIGALFIKSNVVILLVVNKFFSGTLALKLNRWLSTSNDTGIVHLNLVGISANAFFLIAYAFIIDEIKKPILRMASHITEAEIEPKYGYHFPELGTSITRKIHVYSNISMIMLVTIPLFIISGEWMRLLYGILLIYYAVFSYFVETKFEMNRNNYWAYYAACLLLTLLLAGFFIYSTPSANLFDNLKYNLLLG